MGIILTQTVIEKLNLVELTLSFQITDLQFRLAMQGLLEKVPLQHSADSSNDRRDSHEISPKITVGVLRANPVELEELEDSVKQLQTELHEARSRNIYLSNLLEEQSR